MKDVWLNIVPDLRTYLIYFQFVLQRSPYIHIYIYAIDIEY